MEIGSGIRRKKIKIHLDSLSLVYQVLYLFCIYCSEKKKKEIDKEDVTIVLCFWISFVFNAERGESKIKLTIQSYNFKIM